MHGNRTLEASLLNRRQMIRLAGAAGAYGAASCAGLAQSPQWAQIVEAAKKEGAVSIYSGQGLIQLNDLATRVKNDLGITVQVVRAADAELTARVNAERDAGKAIADVFVDTNLAGIKARSKEGHVVAPVGPAFDAADYDKKARVPEGTYFECNATVLTFSWNKELLPKGIKDYPDLIDPSLMGKIGVPGLVAPAYFDFYQFLEEQYGAEFITKLGALKPRAYPGALPMGQAVVSGEIAAALSTQPLIDEIAKGAPVGWGLAPKAWGARFYGQILKVAPHPNAAQVLADYMVTRSGQEALARVNTSVLPNISTAIGNTANVRHLNLDKLTPQFMDEYREKWRKTFQPG